MPPWLFGPPEGDGAAPATARTQLTADDDWGLCVRDAHGSSVALAQDIGDNQTKRMPSTIGGMYTYT